MKKVFITLILLVSITLVNAQRWGGGRHNYGGGCNVHYGGYNNYPVRYTGMGFPKVRTPFINVVIAPTPRVVRMPVVVTAPPKPVVVSTPRTERVWVEAHWEEGSNGRVWVEGHYIVKEVY